MDRMDNERRGSEGYVEQTLLIHDPNYGSNILALLNDLRSQVNYKMLTCYFSIRHLGFS